MVVVGAVVLGFSLRIDPDNTTLFYVCTLGLAAVWTVGAFASGPLHLGRIGHPAEPDLAAPRPVVPADPARGGTRGRSSSWARS